MKFNPNPGYSKYSGQTLMTQAKVDPVSISRPDFNACPTSACPFPYKLNYIVHTHAVVHPYCESRPDS